MKKERKEGNKHVNGRSISIFILRLANRINVDLKQNHNFRRGNLEQSLDFFKMLAIFSSYREMDEKLWKGED